MPYYRNFLLLTATCLFFIVPAHAQEAGTGTNFQKIKAMVDSNRFEIHCTIATTHYSYFLEPGTPYSDQNIRIANDTAFVIVHDSIAAGNLPYFSRGYSIPQTGAKGVVFNNTMADRSVTIKGRGKRKSLNYGFSVTGINDSYKFRIIIQSDGTCYLYVNSTKRSPISYIGQIVQKIH